MHEGFGLEKIFFECTDSTETFFSKLRSAGTITYQVFSLAHKVQGGGGGSHKHCLLTFFICTSCII